MTEFPYRHPTDPELPLFSEACTIVLRVLGSSGSPVPIGKLSESTQLEDASQSEALTVLQFHGAVVMDADTARLDRGALIKAVTNEPTGKMMS